MFEYILMEEFSKGHDVKQEISTLIRNVKHDYFGLDFETGEPTEIRKLGGTFIKLSFSHQGYTLKGQPKNLLEEIEKITVIRVES